MKASSLSLFARHVLMGFGSALVLSLYSVVDAIMVGRYEGERGMAAVATIVPIWTIALSVGLLFGIGGGIFVAKCLGEGDKEKASQYYTAAVASCLAVSLLLWVLLVVFDAQLLTFFGADEETLPLARLYVRPIKWVLPFVIFAQCLTSFVRNDRSPLLASAAVVTGGLTNILFDYLLVFVFDLGIYGAGIATAGSECLAFLILAVRLLFFPKKLRLVKVDSPFKKALDVLRGGFPSFVIDASSGVMALLMNRQIVSYFEGNEALAVYGVIGQISFVVLSFSYGLAHAVQPLVGNAMGKGKRGKVITYLFLGLGVSSLLGLVAVLVSVLAPEGLIALFVLDPDPTLVAAADTYLIPYSGAFFFMVLNVYLLYFFMSSGHNAVASILAILRSVVLPVALLFLFPAFLPPLSLFYAIPAVELMSLLFSFPVNVWFLRKRLPPRGEEPLSASECPLADSEPVDGGK